MRSNKIKNGFSIDDLPSNRKELFFDVLKNHFSLLIGLGLLALCFLIPFLIISVLGDYYSANLSAAFASKEITIDEYRSIYNISSLVFALIQCLTLSIFSIGISGILKVYKRLLFMEPVFFKDDFKLGVKDSWKTNMLTYFLLGLFYTLSRLMNLVNASEFVKALPIGVIIVFVFPIFLLMNTNTSIYVNSYGKRVRVSALLHIRNFFTNMLAAIIPLTSLLVLLINNIVAKYVVIIAVVIFLLPIYMLGYYDFSLYIYDKYINIENYPEIYRKGMIEKKKVEKMRIDVTKYGLISSANELQTNALQKLINDVAKPGDVIYFPKGKYVIGTIFLKSNITIFVDKGAFILGAPSFYDFEPQERVDFPIYQDQSHTYFNCSMFVGKNLENVIFDGEGTIDMRSVWDLDNVRDIVHRGPKCITLVECKNIEIKNLTILNVTDLAVYYVSCENVLCDGLKLKVYIDGISPDNSKHCIVRNCDVESGDDGIVFKTSYNLNRLDYCDDILVENCNIKSRCNPIKFGTESNGGFKNITVQNCTFRDSRITGIAVESVDGAHIENLLFKDIVMYNVGSPFFVYIGKRMRGPKELKIGSIDNVRFENIKVLGPYHVYDCMAWNYVSYEAKDNKQFPGFFSKQQEEPVGTWQITSNVCGLDGNKITNVSFKNIYLELDGGVKEFNKIVPDEPVSDYPEIYAYGRILPAYAIYFRNVDGIKLENINVKLLHKDLREKYQFDKCSNINKD